MQDFASEDNETLWGRRLTFQGPTSFGTMSEESFMRQFRQRPASFDLHDVHFQDWSLQQLPQLPEGAKEWRTYSLSSEHAKKRMLRAAVYGIATRDDLDWHGTPIGDSKEKLAKKTELLNRYRQLRLYDWSSPAGEEYWSNGAPNMRTDPCSVTIETTDTQSATEILSAKYPGSVAWLNMANAVNCCGTYCTDFGGSQEEEVAPNSDACAMLGLCAERIDNDWRTVFERGQPHTQYRIGWRIPRGGSYFLPSRFVTSKVEQAAQVDAFCIATAFADFRPRMPVFTPHSESPDFYSWYGFGSLRVPETVLRDRLMLDVLSTLRTAALNGIEALVLGASGCGAFRHQPDMEASIWRQALETRGYARYFREIVFAILPDASSPRNVLAFQEAFEEPLQIK